MKSSLLIKYSFILLVLLPVTAFFIGYYFTTNTKAADNAIPMLRMPCDQTGDPEFHSLRPYQAAHCGDANKAIYCSNDLIFREDFNMANHGDCTPRLDSPGEIDFTCDPDFTVEPHDLYVQLDDSMFPIMGNTEEVKNSQTANDTYNDATKVNEYASWYLSGVNNKAESGVPTNDQVVNYSGPLQKLLPSAIADAQRIIAIASGSAEKRYIDDETNQEVVEVANHNQIVACAQGDNPIPCYKGDGSKAQGSVYRLKDWYSGDLSLINTFFNTVLGTSAWDKRIPPLPWQFSEDIYYQKAYNEWKGKTCIIVPILNTLACGDIPLISPNKVWSKLFSYVPLVNMTDKKGAEYIASDGYPQYQPAQGTEIANPTSDQPKNAPLYFAHTEEVKMALEILNKTYMPSGVGSIPDEKTTERNNCSVVNIRTNKGDNLFPGDPHEMFVGNVTYQITQVECHETFKLVPGECCTRDQTTGTRTCEYCEKPKHELKCPAEVYITLKTNTKTPSANEIWKSAVADSGSTFRRIYPKVEPNAPVSCIADIPTVTDVTYDPDIGGKTEIPNEGSIVFKVRKYPEDGTSDSPQLTFPHIGSIYEYFLKGIQTALRPQGYGGPQPISGQNCNNLACGELPNLPTASGACALNGPVSPGVGGIPMPLREIIGAAAETYKVPPNLIVAIMYGEGLFNAGRFNWNDTNVKNWATCEKIPNCNESGDDNFMGFNGNDFQNIIKNSSFISAYKKIDPTRTEYSQCNLMDSIFAAAWNLHDSADGGGGLPSTCYGIALRSSVPNSCTWNNEQYESAIKISESGYTNACLTLPGGCVNGGGLAAACPNGDTCERVGSGSQSSHNACVWAVAHGQ